MIEQQDSKQRRKSYVPPLCRFINLGTPINILESLSLEGNLEDFEDGDDI